MFLWLVHGILIVFFYTAPENSEHDIFYNMVLPQFLKGLQALAVLRALNLMGDFAARLSKFIGLEARQTCSSQILNLLKLTKFTKNAQTAMTIR